MDDQTPGTQPPVTPDQGQGQGAPMPQEPTMPPAPQEPAGDQGQATDPNQPAPQAPTGGEEGQADPQPGSEIPPAGNPL